MKITILGSCRQHSLKKKFNVSDIQEELSYPHYTKEILEVIKYCKYEHININETINIFRTPILTKKPPNFKKMNEDFKTTDLFILEIASKIKYIHNDIHLHHIATEEQYGIPIKNEIKIEIQTKDEIEEDILKIKNELNKPFIVISHLVTKDFGERYNLSIWLEEICLKYDIPFINPVKELEKKNVNLENIFIKENVLAHYNEKGHSEILNIYSEFIEKMNII